MKQMAENPVFGDTFSPQGLAWAKDNMGGIAHDIAAASACVFPQGMPEWEAHEMVDNIANATHKTSAFGAALTMGEVTDVLGLTQFGVAVNSMYLHNDSLDGGGARADRTIAAINILNQPRAVQAKRAAAIGGIVHARWTALDTGLTKNVREFALADDADIIIDCFSKQVLLYEVHMQELSRLYAAAQDRPAFLAAYGAKIAEYSTVTAGLPAILVGLHTLYRQEYATVAPLEEAYDNPHSQRLLRIGNFYCRMLDDLGDAPKDGRGLDNPDAAQNSFMLNVFNQYHPDFAQTYLELGEIPAAEQKALHHAIANFHQHKSTHSTFIMQSLNKHIRRTVDALPTEMTQRYPHFVTLFKRIIEIAYVNAQGDEALAGLKLENSPS
jgi:hypothetical protein